MPEFQKTQRVGVTAFIFYDEQVLVVKRAKTEKYRPGFYELPGGKVKYSEPPDKAIKREVVEETNLDVKVIKPYWLFSYMNKDVHMIDIQYICVIMSEDPDVKISSEHDEYKWIAEKELDTIKLSQQMKMAIKQGFSALYS